MSSAVSSIQSREQHSFLLSFMCLCVHAHATGRLVWWGVIDEYLWEVEYGFRPLNYSGDAPQAGQLADVRRKKDN
jgi:hypothetical protein